MPSPLRVALVGYGLAGKTFHAPLIAAVEGLDLACIVSQKPDAVRLDFPDVAIVADLAAALCDTTIDLVVIATPDHLHAEQAIAALDAGKHVVVDKPFAETLEQARRMAERAGASDRLLCVFQNRRWDADFLTLKHLIAEGSLGKIAAFESHFDRFRPTVQDRWKDKRAGGVWQDLGPHLVDQAVHVFGMPEALWADFAIQKPGGLAPDYAHVVLRYPQMRAILHMSQLVAADGVRFAVHGTGGSYIKHGMDPQEDQSKAGILPADAHWGIDDRPGILTRMRPDGTRDEIPVPNTCGDYAAFYKGVRAAISGRGPNPVPPADALAVMQIIDAGYVSADQARWIDIHPRRDSPIEVQASRSS
jgi:predicted dehydrogenase